MSYAQQSDLNARFGRDELVKLTDRTDTGEPDTAIIAHALEDAAAIIDGHLRTRYALPLASVPPLLVDLSCDIARFKLHNAAAPDAVRQRYEDALARLQDIAMARMEISEGGEVKTSTQSVARREGPHPFSRGALERF